MGPLGSPNPSFYGDQTGGQRAAGFVRLSFTGLEKVLERFAELSDSLDPKERETVLRTASKSLMAGYKIKAKRMEATGNLAASTKTKTKSYRSGVSVAVTGPEQTGALGASFGRASGNHAWLVEFGSKPRRPSTQNRRTYINLHQSINGKMSRHSASTGEEFERMGRGYYFLMGSINEPTRQKRMGRGYTHDFMKRPGENMRPMTLHPGETYGGMPASHIMERTIKETAGQVKATLQSGLVQLINKAMG